MQLCLKRTLSASLLIIMSFVLIGCSTTGTHPQDPYESYNRKIFAFNQAVDDVIFNPVATMYTVVIPKPARTGVANFFQNLAEIPRFINRLLQGEIRLAMLNSSRFIFNSTIGLGGLFDPASKLGAPRDRTDFGVTLAKWGAKKKQTYTVLPFFGPSTFRDTAGLVGNYPMTVYPYIENDTVRYSLTGLNLINTRAQLLNLQDVLKEQIDPYIFMRNAYLQNRERVINANPLDPADSRYLAEPAYDDDAVDEFYQPDQSSSLPVGNY